LIFNDLNTGRETIANKKPGHLATTGHINRTG